MICKPKARQRRTNEPYVPNNKKYSVFNINHLIFYFKLLIEIIIKILLKYIFSIGIEFCINSTLFRNRLRSYFLFICEHFLNYLKVQNIYFVKISSSIFAHDFSVFITTQHIVIFCYTVILISEESQNPT